MKNKILLALVVLGILGGLAYIFGGGKSLQGNFSNTQNTAETVIIKTEQLEDGTTEIDWNSTESYLLGKWSVSSSQNIEASKFIMSLDALSEDLDEYFSNLSMDVEDASGNTITTINSFSATATSKVDLDANQIYSFELYGEPIAAQAETFQAQYEGKEVNMWIRRITLEDGTEYVQTKEEDLIYFSGDAYDEIYMVYYSKGGYVLSSLGTTSEETIEEEVTSEEVEDEAVADEAVAEEEVTDDEVTDEEVQGETQTEDESDAEADGTDEDTSTASETGVLELRVIEKVAGKNLYENLDTANIAVYDSRYSLTDSEPETASSATITVQDDFFSIEAEKGEYNIVISQPGYLNSIFGPYSTAENGFYAETEEGKLAYNYYLTVQDNLLGPVSDATVTATSGTVSCSIVDESNGIYGCPIPYDNSDISWQVDSPNTTDSSGLFYQMIPAADGPEENWTAEVEGTRYFLLLKILDSGTAVTGLTSADFTATLSGDTVNKILEVYETDAGAYSLKFFEYGEYSVNISAESYSEYTVEGLDPEVLVDEYMEIDLGTGESKKVKIESATIEEPSTTDTASTESQDSAAVADTSSSSTETQSSTSEETVNIQTGGGSRHETGSDSFAADAIVTDTSTEEDESVPSGESKDLAADTEKEEYLTSADYNICSDNFKDTVGHWGQNTICRLYYAGILNGKTTTTFAPDKSITRAEFLKVALRNAGYEESDADGLNESYKDVYSSHWFAPYVKIAQNGGMIDMNDGNFYPNRYITRADAVLLLARIADKTLNSYTKSQINYSDVAYGDYYTYAVIIAEQKGIIEGYSDGTFKPGNYITRAEVAAIVLRSYLAWYK